LGERPFLLEMARSMCSFGSISGAGQCKHETLLLNVKALGCAPVLSCRMTLAITSGKKHSDEGRRFLLSELMGLLAISL